MGVVVSVLLTLGAGQGAGLINLGAISWLLLGMVGLMLLGAVDDYRPLSWKLKLVIQFVCAWMACLNLPDNVFLQNPTGIVIACVLLVTVINFVNFIDGIDEISVAHSLPTLAVAVVFSLLLPAALEWGALAVTLMAALIGFWFWNRHPAQVFLGDSGSLPLGLALGWFALLFAIQFNPLIGMLMLAYPVGDAGTTLVRRALARRALTVPHRWHAYQQAVDKGVFPRAVALRVGILSTLAGCLAIVAVHFPHVLIAMAGVLLVSLAVGLQISWWLLTHSRRGL